MIRKFDEGTDGALLDNLPFTYVTSFPYIQHAVYVLKRDGVEELVCQDSLYPNDFPYLFVPRNRQLWSNALMLWVNEENLEVLEREVSIEKVVPIGHEHVYTTDEFVGLKGKKRARFRRKVNAFENSYSYTLASNCDEKEVLAFFTRWENQQQEKTHTYEESKNFFLYCVQNREKFDLRTLFVFIENELAGITMGVLHGGKRWVGLHQKVDYQYKGLGHFLHHKRAELFKECDEFTLGTGCFDEGITKHKEGLHPIEKKPYFFVMTGERK